MEVIYKPVGELIEYEGNARRNDAGVAKVAESIKEFGFLNPILITADNVIISGHTRLKAARQLGLEEVPCIVREMSDEDAKLARIIDNKSHEYSTWDVGKLHQELSGINLDFKTTFFTPNRDRKFFTDNKFLIFGNNELPISEDEYNRLKAVYDVYIAEFAHWFVNHFHESVLLFAKQKDGPRSLTEAIFSVPLFNFLIPRQGRPKHITNARRINFWDYTPNPPGYFSREQRSCRNWIFANYLKEGKPL